MEEEKMQKEKKEVLFVKGKEKEVILFVKEKERIQLVNLDLSKEILLNNNPELKIKVK